MADGGDSGRFERPERTPVVGALVWFHWSVRSDEDPLRTVEPAIVARVISRDLVDLRVIGPHGAVYDETGVFLWAGYGQRACRSVCRVALQSAAQAGSHQNRM